MTLANMTVRNEITIVVGKEKVKATAKGGAVGNGSVKLDQLRLATIRVFEELLLDDIIHKPRLMEVLGQHLYEGIFDVEIDNLLTKELQGVKKDRLRLQLQFESDVDSVYGSLPWEFLYSPTRKDFLATDANLVLSRYMELGENREVLSTSEEPLRVLVVISRPEDERVVLAKEVVKAIEDLNTEQGKIVSLVTIEQPTLKSIESALKVHRPHIFHFIGHGKYNREQKTGYLLLVNSSTNNNSDLCDDSTLIRCFRDTQCFPGLVFLHMCESGITEKDATILQAFSGFAPKLIHAKIPSVVAMQYPIKNLDACNFSLAFYSSLAKGSSVDEAVQEGRRELDRNHRSRLFGTPVLYMHSAGSLVLPKPSTSQRNFTGNLAGEPVEEIIPRQASDTASKSSGVAVAVLVSTDLESVRVNPATLDQVIDDGIKEAQSIPDSDTCIALSQRLIKMRKSLIAKTRKDVFSEFIEASRLETNALIKNVWETMIAKL